MSVQFRIAGKWYVAVSKPDQPRKLSHVFELMKSRPLKLGWLSPIRAAAKSALRSA